MEISLGKHKLRGFSSSSLICSECWFVFDSVWASCIFLGICSFLCYPVGWYAVAGSIYGLVYMFALSGNASSFILILFIWVLSIFLVDSRKRFVDFIYLWNENNNKNQSTFCSIDFFSIVFCIFPHLFQLESWFLSFSWFSCFLLFTSSRCRVWDLASLWWGIYHCEFSGCFFLNSVSFGVLCFHLMCMCIFCNCPFGFFFISFANTVLFNLHVWTFWFSFCLWSIDLFHCS